MKARVENHGSIALFYALDKEAFAWVDELIVTPETQFWSDAVVVEPRYMENLLRGFVRDGGEVVR